MKDKEIIDYLKEVLAKEECHLKKLYSSIDNQYITVTKKIAQVKGKLVIIGVGKSGYIAQKIAATMTSIGVESYFIHPSEACHGDLGRIQKKDIVLLISKSGESEEILHIIPSLKLLKIPLIAISARKESSLAKNCHHLLWLPLEKEACPLDLVPTSSTLLSLAVGDALALTLMKMKKFQKKDFARFHPAGSLGKKLTLRVEDLMLKGKKIPFLQPDEKMEKIIITISQGMINAAIVVNKKQELLGLITSYNIREAFQKKNIFSLSAKEIMNPNPTTFPLKSNAFDALLFMKQGKNVLNVLPIIEKKKVFGILSLQSLIKAGL